MSQSNEINFGPVFMRGRKPAPVTNKTNPISNNPPGPNQTLLGQSYKSTGGPTSAMIKSNQHSLSAAPSPAINTTSLPLPKSFSAAVSPGKEVENRSQSNGIQNVWDTNANHSPDPGSPHISPPADYSREALLNLYSEHLAAKLPPDLEINDPAVTLEAVGPPLALVEMTEAEKELFAGPFNSEKRPTGNKVPPHHPTQEHPLGLNMSPETVTNHGLPNNRLSVGGAVKLGKHGSTERFNSLGIQGGVLAGVASSTHSNPRRRGDHEPDTPEAQRRLQRAEDTSGNTGSWNGHLRDRRARDSGPPVDGKWKRGISFEEKIQSQDSSGGGNLKYSVLDKMREKAALGISSKESYQSPAPATPTDQEAKGGDPHPSTQPWGTGEDHATGIDEQAASSPNINEPSTPANVMNPSEPSVGSVPHIGTESSVSQPASNDLNPEDIAWQYRDPSGTVQGPFTAFQMQEWYKATFFREDLLVKRVIDAAFETLETLILRVGDRDRPFLARPPPALPPNLPLPHGHSHNRQLHTSQPSPQLSNPNISDQTAINAPRTDSSSVGGSSLTGHSTSASNQFGGVPTPDPWNNIAPRSSPLTRPETLLESKPMVSGTVWNSSLPAFAHPHALQNVDFEITRSTTSIIEYDPNTHTSNAYVPHDPETLRFLQQVQHPALSIAASNGYPLPLPTAHVPNFGQIPSMPPLINGSAMIPILAAQLQSRLMHAPYLFNHPVAGGADEAERATQANFAPPTNHLDPWQVPTQPPHDIPTGILDQNQLQSALMTPNQNQSAFSSNSGDRVMPNLVPSVDAIPETRANERFMAGLEFQDRNKLSMPDHKSAEIESQQMSTTTPQLDSATFPDAAESRAPHITSSLKLVPTGEQESGVNMGETSVATPHTPSPQDKLTSKSSNADAASAQLASTAGISAKSDSNQAWQNVTYQPAAQPQNATQTTTPVVPTPSAPKSTGKLVVLSKAQQDEHERRTASIQKTQLQLKEAHAVERAAREASEAAAAAVTASFNTPAPWSKEEKPLTNMSLTEIQAIEAKQAEKRRLAEKQAAANRAMVERTMAAERVSKTAKEALPSTSNWAATASSPIKSSTPGTVWKPKESDGPSMASGPKQSMKQIQEEEARKKSLALQQANKSAGSNVTKAPGGYAGTVASAKPAVGGPWSVVGAKSKVIAPPPTTNHPSIATGNPVVASVTTRGGVTTGTISKPVPKPPVSINKTPSKPPQTAPIANATGNNSSNTAANNLNTDGPPPASPEFMRWLREALRGMNNVEDFVKMLLDFPINPDESVLEIVSDSVYAGSATLDGRRFAKEFNARRMADVASRTGKGGTSGTMKNGEGSSPAANGIGGSGNNHQSKKTGNFAGFSSNGTMADAVKYQPTPKNDGWGFAVVGAKKKKK